MPALTIELRPGDQFNLPVQCVQKGAGIPSVFGSTDVLSASIWQPGATSATIALNPPVWYTVTAQGVAQTGYGQGQILIPFMANQTAVLQPSITYQGKAFRLPVGATVPERIAEFSIKILPLA